MRNLDRLAAETAQAIIADTKKVNASEVENLATKTLGVLQDNGVYAVVLYLFSRTSKDAEVALHVRKHLLCLPSQLQLSGEAPTDNAECALSFVTEEIACDLDTLLLVKQVWEQTLIYARYGAKAREVRGVTP